MHYIEKEMNLKNDEVALLKYENDCHKEGLILICVALGGKTRASGYNREEGRQ